MKLLALLAVLALLPGAASAAGGASGLRTPVVVSVVNQPVEQFLDAVSRQAKLNFVLADDYSAKLVTVSLRGVPASQALDQVLGGQGLGYRQVGQSNLYVVGAQGSFALQPPAPVQGGRALDRIVTIRLKDAPLSQLALLLSTRTKAQFALAAGLADQPVTFFLNQVTVREALDVLAVMKGLSCRPTSSNPESYLIQAGS